MLDPFIWQSNKKTSENIDGERGSHDFKQSCPTNSGTKWDPSQFLRLKPTVPITFQTEKKTVCLFFLAFLFVKFFEIGWDRLVQFVPSFSSPPVEDAQNGPSSIASPLDLVTSSQGQRLLGPVLLEIKAAVGSAAMIRSTHSDKDPSSTLQVEVSSGFLGPWVDESQKTWKWPWKALRNLRCFFLKANDWHSMNDPRMRQDILVTEDPLRMP